jgi:hypothetical protein
VSPTLSTASSRASGGSSRQLGLYLDPAADKLLLVSAYVVLAIPNLHAGYTIPAWISALVVTRDIVIVVVALTLYLAAGVKRFPPSPISKINTFVQLAAVILVLLSTILPGLEMLAAVAVHAVAVLRSPPSPQPVQPARRGEPPRRRWRPRARPAMPAMALTDHGNLFGAIEFYEGERAGVKPILGIEAYVAQGSREDRDPATRIEQPPGAPGAKREGYRNLLKLTTSSYLEASTTSRASIASCSPRTPRA